MADAVTTNVVFNGKDMLCVHLTGISDGTGESAVTKVDKSAYLAADGAEPASLDIAAVRWNIQGHASVRLLWDHTTDDVAMVLCGSGFEDFQFHSPVDGQTQERVLRDPRSAGETGDIKLTTNGHVSGATYDITLWLKKQSD